MEGVACKQCTLYTALSLYVHYYPVCLYYSSDRQGSLLVTKNVPITKLLQNSNSCRLRAINYHSHHSICHSRKSYAVRKLHGSMCYRSGVIDDRGLHYGNEDCRRFLLPWTCPWPDDLHVRTSPVFPGEIYRMSEY